MKEIRVGIIGLGRGCTFVRNGKMVKGQRIVALCDRFDLRLKNAYDLAQDPEVRCYRDHREMLEKADLDAVVIAVAPEDNADLVVEMLEAGKHVLCEVPLAFTIEDCWRVVLAVEKSGLKFQMAEQVRYSAFIQAWRKMVRDGTLGKVVFVEGEYLHGMPGTRFSWRDAETGRALTPEQAQNNPQAKRDRMWNLIHPIRYLPHELSPILHILDDRVTKVTCMATRQQSYVYEWLPLSDIEVALMHTEKDTILRLACGFTVNTIMKDSTCGYHWYHVMGTKGTVETNRSNADQMKMWLADSQMKDPAELIWEYSPDDVPAAALASGHGGMDYFPYATFIESILKDTPTVMDVYTAADTAAPAIIAGQSAEQGCQCLSVPDFRPGPTRQPGQEPEEGLTA